MAIYKIRILDSSLVVDRIGTMYRNVEITFPEAKVPILHGVSLHPWGLSHLSLVDGILYATFDTNERLLRPFMYNLHKLWLLPEGRVMHGNGWDINRPLDGRRFTKANIERVVVSPERHLDGFPSIGEQIDEQIFERIVLDENHTDE